MRKYIFYTTLFLGLAGFAQNSDLKPLNEYITATLKKENSEIEYKITATNTNDLGVTIYYGIQTYQNYSIVGTEFNAIVSKGELISLNHHFLVNPSSINKINVYKTSAAAVLQFLVKDYPIKAVEIVETNSGEYNYVNQDLSDEPIKIYKKWMLIEDKLIPVYEVSLYEKDHQHWYNTIVDASTKQILNRVDWVAECDSKPEIFRNISKSTKPINPSEDKIESTHANSGYRVFAMPLESPNHGSRTFEEDPENIDASPYGWHDVNGIAGAEYTITRGNNVWASEDKNDDNSPGYSPDGGSSLIFDYDYDITKSAALYTDASITNLFYWNNLMHDVWWHYGFDEQSGNFQQNNYSRGGFGGDYVNADAQDGSGSNNANFATPPDGQNPRMQMYLWSSNSAGDHFQVNSPSFATGKYTSSTAVFGPRLTKTPITDNLVLVNSGGSEARRGCSALQNATQVNGKIAFIERGSCTFVQKVKNAQNAGAIAVVIFDSTANNPIDLGGTDNSITIPSIMIRKNDGQYILGLLASQNVSVSLYDSSTTGAITFDSDFDNGVIAHEYGHGISNRLTGGAANASCLTNQEQMGEGWSDFFALVMTHEAGDAATDLRGIGTYVSNEQTTGSGIRNYPYSTDINNSSYTYNNIKSFSVPHGVGSVWCSMLWDMYWLFIDEYGYDSDIYEGTGGNNMAMQLVIDGMKLQPCSPGFVDGRDAILLADRLRNGGKNQKIIWDAFARRGLGYDASQGSSNSRSDGISAFNFPPYLNGELVLEKEAEKQSVNNENLTYKITVSNFNDYTISDIVLKDTLVPEVQLINATLSCNATVANNVISFKVDSLVAGDSFVCYYTVIPKLSETTKVLWLDNIEDGEKNWTKSTTLGNSGFEITTARKKSGARSWFVPNDATSSDYALQSSFDITGNAPALSFSHFYNSEESWDGAVVEYKLENGSWIDAEELFIANGYNSTISVNPQSSLSGRKAFTGSSDSFINSKIDFSGYIGSTIDVRFRFASDGAEASEGWYIDDIQLEDLATIKNYVHCAYADSKEKRTGVLTIITGEGNEVSIKEREIANSIEVYPNPTSGIINIVSDKNEEMSITLYDIAGKLLYQANTKSTFKLDLRTYNSGVYVLEISIKGTKTQRRVIKE